MSYHRRHFVSGRGAYRLPADFLPRGWFSKWGSRAGRDIGSRVPVAPAVFAELGCVAGRHAGNYLSRLTGTGKYKTKGKKKYYRKRSRYAPSNRMKAKFSSGNVSFGGSSVRVRHRELVALVDATSTFQAIQIPINPGLDTSFPWLSQIAQNFQKYKVNRMIWQFVSTSSNAIASTTNLGLGTVCMSTQYNTTESPFRNLQEALSADHANSGRPSMSMLHAIECNSRDRPTDVLYVRTGPIPDYRDPALYDLANFNFCTDMPANYTGLGQLWVSYDVTFLAPHLISAIGKSINTDFFKFDVTGVTATALLGTKGSAHPNNNLGCQIDFVNQRVLFPPLLQSGYFFVIFRLRSSSATATPAFGGVTIYNGGENGLWNDYSWGSFQQTGTDNQILYIGQIAVVGNDAYIQFPTTGNTLPAGTLEYCELVIQQVNGDIRNKPALTEWVSIS